MEGQNKDFSLSLYYNQSGKQENLSNADDSFISGNN